MMLFFAGVAILVLGYFTYGALVEKIFAPTDNPTPAITMADGVDYVKLPLWRIIIIQFLNIAGLGPIYTEPLPEPFWSVGLFVDCFRLYFCRGSA